MEENETPHPDYIKGFNEGYLLSTHLPDIAQAVARSNSSSFRSAGFVDGTKQRQLELQRENYPAWRKEGETHKAIPPEIDHPEISPDKEMDDLEPDV